MYEEQNGLSFYARKKQRQFWNPCKIPYKRKIRFFNFLFRFLLK